MLSTYLSPFNPNMMTPETLEAIFVKREALAERLMDIIEESAKTPAKHHALMIGPRGIGKSHLIMLIYHRIKAKPELKDRLRIARLSEEEWSISSFLNLLVTILRALQTEYNDPKLVERIEALYGPSQLDAERAAANLLQEYVGERTLLVLAENMDEIFSGLEDEGQKKLRSYLQEQSFSAIVATAQCLFNGVSSQDKPFYGFFEIEHLQMFTLEEATGLLEKIAHLHQDEELARYIITPVGRARIRAIQHLSGGNPRVYIIFAQFISRESLDELVKPFMKTLDELTPYYQERMRWLSPQQRMIIEFLCERRGAVQVKEIARRCFITHQTASSQLKELRDKGYVHSIEVGRESHYELSEPLMRMCVEIKKNHGEPIRLFVDFLRFWHSLTELEKRLNELPEEAKLEREYVLHAIRLGKGDLENPVVSVCEHDLEIYMSINDYHHSLQIAEELSVLRGEAWDWALQGSLQDQTMHYQEALHSFCRATELDPDFALAWSGKGHILTHLNDFDEAVTAYDEALEAHKRKPSQGLNPSEVLVNKGSALIKLNKLPEALKSFTMALDINPLSDEAWYGKGYVLKETGDFGNALEAYDQVLIHKPNDSFAWDRKAHLLQEMGNFEAALEAYEKSLELNSQNTFVWTNKGVILQKVGRYQEALNALEMAIHLDPQHSCPWLYKGDTLLSLGKTREALGAYEETIKIKEDDVVLAHKGFALFSLGEIDEAIQSLEKALQLNSESVIALQIKGVILGSLGKEGEAVEIFRRVLDLNPNDPTTLYNLSVSLQSLGRYKEALDTFKQMEVIDPTRISPAFFKSNLLFNANEWEEGFEELDLAVSVIKHSHPKKLEDTSSIIINILKSSLDITIWSQRVTSILSIFKKYKASSMLGTGLVYAIPELFTPMCSLELAESWLKVWREAGGRLKTFKFPLHLLEIAVRYKKTGDRRVLLELPLEERQILEPLVMGESS
jgi:tetratricopeptide (TPR) repeat protein